MMAVLRAYALDAQGNSDASFLLACKQGDKATVEKVLADKHSYEHYINCADECEKSTCLVIASQNSQEDIIKLLIEKGVNVEQEGGNQMTALMWAARNAKLTIAQRLVETGRAKVENGNTWGQTPLMIARRMQNPELVHYLEDHRERWTDDTGQSIWILIALGCFGGLLLSLFEYFEDGAKAAAPPGWRLRLFAWLGIPVIGGFLVYVFVLAGSQLTALLAIGIGLSGPALVRAWRKKPLTFSLGELPAARVDPNK
jgi:hypothetical protein